MFHKRQAGSQSAIRKQKHLYLLLCDGEPWWHAINDAANALAVRFSKRRHTERVAKCVSTRTDRQRELPTAPATASVQRHRRPQIWLEHLLSRRQASFHAMRPVGTGISNVQCGPLMSQVALLQPLGGIVSGRPSSSLIRSSGR